MLTHFCSFFSSQAQYFFVAKLLKHFAFSVRYSLTTWLFVYMNYYTHNAKIFDSLMYIFYMFNLIDMNYSMFLLCSLSLVVKFILGG